MDTSQDAAAEPTKRLLDEDQLKTLFSAGYRFQLPKYDNPV